MTNFDDELERYKNCYYESGAHHFLRGLDLLSYVFGNNVELQSLFTRKDLTETQKDAIVTVTETRIQKTVLKKSIDSLCKENPEVEPALKKLYDEEEKNYEQIYNHFKAKFYS